MAHQQIKPRAFGDKAVGDREPVAEILHRDWNVGVPRLIKILLDDDRLSRDQPREVVLDQPVVQRRRFGDVDKQDFDWLIGRRHDGEVAAMHDDLVTVQRGLELKDCLVIVVGRDRVEALRYVLPDVLVIGDKAIVAVDHRMRGAGVTGLREPRRQRKGRCPQIGPSVDDHPGPAVMLGPEPVEHPAFLEADHAMGQVDLVGNGIAVPRLARKRGEGGFLVDAVRDCPAVLTHGLPRG